MVGKMQIQDTATQPKKKGTGRNTEKRRERSKVAARFRRSKESEIFQQLSDFLPLPEATRNGLDKASVMRLSLSDLKLRQMMENVFQKELNRAVMGSERIEEEKMRLELDSCVSNAMGGFLIVISTEGDIVYVTESVSTHLGLAQVELMGLSIYEFAHPCDTGDIKELLSLRKEETDAGVREASLRMKCTITSRGRNVHLRAATYKVIEFSGRMFVSEEGDTQWFVGIGEPLLHPSDVDIPLNKQTFLTKHSPDMKCTFVDDSIFTFLGYKPDDVVGTSLFEFFHAADGPAMAKTFKSLYAKGQAVTKRYRFLAKYGGWVWVVTQATMIQGANGTKPNAIVCLNFVTSGIENEEEILSAVQSQSATKEADKIPVTGGCKIELDDGIPFILEPSKAIGTTTAVIAPRTKDMDSGFLIPCQNTLVPTKDEPEDLEHLAPIPGDTCVPLDPLEMDTPPVDISVLLREMQALDFPTSYEAEKVVVNMSSFPLLKSAAVSPPAMSPSTEMSLDCKDRVGDAPSPLLRTVDPTLFSPESSSSLLSPFQQSSPGGCFKDMVGQLSDFSSSPSSSMNEMSPLTYDLTTDTDCSPPSLFNMSVCDGIGLKPGVLPDPVENIINMPKGYEFGLSGRDKTIVTQPQLQTAFLTLPDGRKIPVTLGAVDQVILQNNGIPKSFGESPKSGNQQRPIQRVLDTYGPVGAELQRLVGQPTGVNFNSYYFKESALPSIVESLKKEEVGPPMTKTARLSYGTTRASSIGLNQLSSQLSPPTTVNNRVLSQNERFARESDMEIYSPSDPARPIDPPWENKTTEAQRCDKPLNTDMLRIKLQQLLGQGRLEEVRQVLNLIHEMEKKPLATEPVHGNLINTGTRKRDNHGLLVRNVQQVRLDKPILPLVPELTRQDCEVNAPLTGRLLDGMDLLSALDISPASPDFGNLFA